MAVRRSTAAIVLAAGASTRMGEPKLIMPYGASTVIGTVVETMNSTAVDESIVVTGFHSDAVASVLPPGTRTAHNDDPGRGNLSSLLVGLEAVGDPDAVVVVLADMPGVTASSVNRLLALWEGSDVSLCWVKYADGRGHPLLLDSSLFDMIDGLSGERALWSFAESLDASTVGVVRVPTDKPADINSLEDYQGALRVLGLD
jgi:molybdenum cofactor cytidylyltransferase